MSVQQKEQDLKVVSIIERWWKSMFLSTIELEKLNIYPAPTVFKAQLRRSSTLEAIVMTDGFRSLWFQLPQEWREQYGETRFEQIALLAGALVYIKQDVEQAVAELAGQKEAGKDKSPVSPMRFSQLLESQDNTEFLRRLRRVLALLDGKANVHRLVSDLNKWFLQKNVFKDTPSSKRVVVRWAMDYYKFSN
ncbi:MAG: type I-E CRISPR-associated protein Cse2/CasB [Pelistega sp.]|nr:type I-E CRISPR-associated protein Cse2/CasB [Pelistega sp.]